MLECERPYLQASAGKPGSLSVDASLAARERLLIYLSEEEASKVDVSTGPEAEATITRARKQHKQESEGLLDAFAEKIKAAFSLEAAKPSPSRGDAQKSTEQGQERRSEESKYVEHLVQVYAGLCRHAWALSPTISASADLDLISRALKLVQHLLKSELQLKE